MRLLCAALLTSILAYSAVAQTYTISTVAGGGFPLNIPGTSASLDASAPQYVTADPAGNVFFPEYDSVLRVDATKGILTLVAGNGTSGFSGDNGPATNAQLYFLGGVAADSAGNLYIADTGNNRIRKVSSGVITTFAGNGTYGSSGDNGPATSAQVAEPSVLTVDPAGNLYFVDSGNIRKVSNGVVTTVLANNGPGGIVHGSGNSHAPGAGLAVDSAGNLYFANGFNSISKASNGVMTIVAGNGIFGFSGDNGPATSAQLGSFNGLAVDAAGNLYIADTTNNRIRRVSNGVITTVAGGGSSLGDNGPATSAQLNSPTGIALDSAGNLYFLDTGNNRIRKVSNGVITTIAGNGTDSYSGDNGPATSAQLNQPQDVAVDSDRNLYIADTGSSRIRKVTNGVITTVAGNGANGFTGDNGPTNGAQLNSPNGVAVDSVGNLYIADTGNNRIRKVSNGVITTVAGGGPSLGDNGPATSAQLNAPAGLAVDSAGNLYIADTGNNRVRKVSSGVITTIAGNGTMGSGGDNGPAASAALNQPTSVAVDSAGNVFIANGFNGIRKVSSGVITTVAANSETKGLAVDSAGNLYISEYGSIGKVSGGVITTIAGRTSGFEAGFGGDNGPAISAQFYPPAGVTVDSSGNVFFAEGRHIRLLTPTNSSCTYSVTPTLVEGPASGGNINVSIQTAASCSWTIFNLPAWIAISGASWGAGSATVTLKVAPNSGTPLSAAISVAGASVTVTQSPASTLPGCTYAINPVGQAFSALGGSGIINVATNPGCPWTATSTVSWVSITGTATGTGNGIVTYQVAPNIGPDRLGSLTLASVSFTIEEATASIPGFTTAGSMAQVAAAGHWTTTITLINTGTAGAQARLNFFDNSGNPLPLGLFFPQSPAAGPLLAATLDRTVNAGGVLVISATGPDNAPTQVGWAQLLTNGAISGFAVLQQVRGSNSQQAVAPLENRNASAYVLSFDNTNGAATGVALANTSTEVLNTSVKIRDDTGAVILTDTITLPASGHLSFDLASRYASTAQRLGTVEFDTPAPGQISVLGLQFNSAGAFSTIPAIAK